MHVCVRALKVLLSDKCQQTRNVNINFSTAKVRCVPMFIVIGSFIVAVVRGDILSWLFSQVSGEKGNKIPQHAYTLLRKNLP